MAPRMPAAVEGKAAAPMKKRGYVTFLAGDGDYVKGAVGLAKGLRKVKSAYQLVAAVLSDVPEEHRQILRMQGCAVWEIEPVYPPENRVQFAMDYYVINYSKLRIWNGFVRTENSETEEGERPEERSGLEEYSKMIYLDADTQVFENIDHLFDMAGGNFYAVMDCFCEKTRLTAAALLQHLESTAPTPFAEQDLLNAYFGKMYKPIPLIYNLVLAMLWRHPENVELGEVKVVHYCAVGSKPWTYTGEGENMKREDIKLLVKKWWDIYNDESLDFKEEEEAEAFYMPSSSFAASKPEPLRLIHAGAPSAT
ncbi:Galactinol synthase 1 [Platanthera guangdongensis]|uniref:Hexosyltransferase n=1 Tax=Platanthera guangdongensis TaxID=2320717 RepID=A0ABR2LDR5_9ASPA